MTSAPNVPLDEVCTIVGGGTPRRNQPEYFGGTIPWATPTDVTALDGLFIEVTKECITEKGLKESSARLVPAGTVLMTSRATIGFTAIARVPMATNQGFANLICGDRVLPEYLAIWLPSQRDKLLQLAGGTTFKEISKSNLKTVRIPLPPIEEQRRIVDVLNRAASIERLRRQASAHLRDFIPALFLKMFGDPIENPMGWPTSVLGDLVGGFEGGKNIEAGSGNSPYRILKVSAVTSGSFVADESKPAPDNYDPPSHHFVREGDILFSRANTAELVGATAVVDMAPTGLLLPDKLWRVVPKRNSAVIPLFLLQFLKDRSTRSALSRLATGTSSSMQNISQGKLKTLRVITPPLDLQLRFSKLAEAAQARAHLADSANTLAAGLSRSLLDKMLGADRS